MERPSSVSPRSTRSTERPKKQRTVSPSLSPIIPADDAPIPQPVQPGRPKGSGTGPRTLSCPFANKDREEPICLTYPDPVPKGKVCVHSYEMLTNSNRSNVILQLFEPESLENSQ